MLIFSLENFQKNKIGKIYKLHTDSERPNIQDNIQDPVWKISMLKDLISIDWDVETPTEKWFILSWSHIIVNGHNHFSTIWNVSDCRKIVYIEMITPYSEWSQPFFYNLKCFMTEYPEISQDILGYPGEYIYHNVFLAIFSSSWTIEVTTPQWFKIF